MSITRAGVSTFSFIKSSSVVPPATNRTSAPCCAVFACAAVATAAAESAGRTNSKVCMGSLLLAAKGFCELVGSRSEEHTSELQSRLHLVCRLLLEKKKKIQ